MTLDEVKREALRRWRELPPEERRTTDQAAVFALRLAYSEGLGLEPREHVYRRIKVWLRADRARS